MRSTPTPEATRRTVKVAPASVPCLTARTMPSNAWRRTFLETTVFLLAFFWAFIFSIFCQTRTVSPARSCKLARTFMLTGDILTTDFSICKLKDSNTASGFSQFCLGFGEISGQRGLKLHFFPIRVGKGYRERMEG